MPTPSGLFIVDTGGRLQSSVETDSALPESRNICHLLGVRDDNVREKLAHAVQQASTLRTQTLMIIGRETEHRKIVSIRPARELGLAVVTASGILGVIDDLGADDLVELFSLSPAEAEIAILLGQGSSVGAVAEYRQVQTETVRGQVKDLLRKIGVANQKQLAAMLAQVAVVRRELTRANERAKDWLVRPTAQ
jgi:DNA-binding CsgD family transcriptional regulator